MKRPSLCAALVATLFALLPSGATADSFDCLMDPADMVELGSAVSGLLDEVLVERGTRVTRGQAVARLNSEMEASTVELLRVRATSTSAIEAQADQLAMIEKRYGRISELRQRGIATEDAYDQVEAERIAARSLLFQAELNREIAQMELARAETALEQRTIRSPIDGIVSRRVLSAGEYISSDDHVAEIVQLDPLKIEAFVPVSLYGDVAVGQGATVSPAAPLSGEYPATVVAVDRVFDAASGTFIVQLELPNPDGALPAGHRCRLAFDGL